MSDIHIYKPKVISSSFRILPKFCRIFLNIEFPIFMEALRYGLEHFKKGFRIFKQRCYKYHEPDNILLAKIENIEGEV